MIDETKNKESRELECATLWKLNEEVILVRYKDGIHLDVDDAIEVSAASIALMEDRKFLALVDARNMGGTLGKKAGDYFAKDENLNAHMKAQALVVNSLAIKLIARFYLKINKPLSEAKIFNEIEEAMDWLETKKNLLV